MTAARIERSGLFDQIAGARAAVPAGVSSANQRLAGALGIVCDKDNVLSCQWKGNGTLAATFSEATKVFHVWQGRNRMAIDAVGLDVDGKLDEAFVVSRDDAGSVIRQGPRVSGQRMVGADGAAHPEVGEALAIFRDGKLVRLAPVLYKDPTAQIIATLETNEVPADWLTCRPHFGWYSLFRERYGLKTFHGTYAAGQPACTTLVLAATSPGAYALPASDAKCYTCGKSSKIAARPAASGAGAGRALAPVDDPGSSPGAHLIGGRAPRPAGSGASRAAPSLLAGPGAGAAPPPKPKESTFALSATAPVVPAGALLAVWGGIVDNDVKATRLFGLFDWALPFSTAGRAIAWASTITVAQREQGTSIDGAAVILSGGGYFIGEVSVGGIVSFSRARVETLTTLDTSVGTVPGVVCFITCDGYVAPVTRSASPLPDIPAEIVDRKRAGGYWQPTRFPSDAELRQARDDVESGTLSLTQPALALAFFRGVLRARALSRLDENRAVTLSEVARYADLGPRNAAWPRLRQIIRKDREAAAAESAAQQRLTDAGTRMASAYPPSGGGAGVDYGAMFRPAVEAAGAELAQIRMVRATLRRVYPAVAALDTSKIADTDPDAAVLSMMGSGMADARDAIEEAYRRVHEDDIQVNKLGPVIDQVCEELGITQAKRASGDPFSKAALDWLDTQDRTEAIIRWVGTIFTVALGIGALIASGGTAALLGLAGAATGVGTAVYEFDQASSLYAVGKGGVVGKPIVADLDQARFSYIMAWVNLVLAGLDLSLAAHAATPIVKGALAAERMAGKEGAEILARMKWQDVATVEQAVSLRAAGKAAEADQILEDLRKTLGADTVEKATALFARRAAVEKVLGELTADLGEEAVNKLVRGLGDEALGEIGKDGVKALVAEHGAEGVIKLKDKLGEALFRALAKPIDNVPGLAPKLLGELAEKISRELLEKVGADALRAFAGALTKGEEFERVITKLGPELARRVGVGLGRDLIADLGDKALLQIVEDLDGPAWKRVVEGVEALGARNDEAACKLLADEVQGVQGARAHSIGRHGPELTDQALTARLTTGVAADGHCAFTSASTRFKSYRDWLKTRQEAINGAHATGVDVTTPPSLGGDTEAVIIVEHKAPIDEGFVGSGTRRRVQDPTGRSRRTGNIWSASTPVGDLTRTKTVFKWNGSANGVRGNWEMITHYPLADDWNQVTKTYAVAADYVVQ